MTTQDNIQAWGTEPGTASIRDLCDRVNASNTSPEPSKIKASSEQISETIKRPIYPRDIITRYIPAMSPLTEVQSKHVPNKCQTTKSISLDMEVFVTGLFITIKKHEGTKKSSQKTDGLKRLMSLT